MKPRLIVEQKITAFVNKYKVFAANEAGEKGELMALAQQKRLAFKEKVTFYSDEAKSNELFTFRAEKVLDVHGRYLVEDMSGKMLGGFRKQFKKSLFVSSWMVIDADGNDVYEVKEGNVALAVLRRFLAFVPYVGDILEIIIKFFRYHFKYVKPGTEEQVAEYTKTTLFRDHYRLDATDEVSNAVDWRVLAAMSVALDALQSR